MPTEGVILSGISGMRWDCSWMALWRIPLTGAEGVSGISHESLRQKDSVEPRNKAASGVFCFDVFQR